MARIRHSSYLSHSQLVKYLKFLQDKKLLQFDSAYKHYTLTEKGLSALGAFGRLNEMMSNGDRPEVERDISAPRLVYPYRRLLEQQA